MDMIKLPEVKPIKLPEAICESCGHRVKNYSPLLDHFPCPSCLKRIDLR